MLGFGVVLLAAALAACKAGSETQAAPARVESAPAMPAAPAPANHAFARVTECVRDFAETDWCDARHLEAVRDAIDSRRPDFAGHYLLVAVAADRERDDVAIAAIDAVTGVVYPVPVDAFGGYVDAKGFPVPSRPRRIEYRIDAPRVCISGTQYEYRNSYDNVTTCYVIGTEGFEFEHLAGENGFKLGGP
jgi:hypothetical protein